MSEMSVDEARGLCTMPWHDGDRYDFDKAAGGFDRMIAEVERAAAEKAWDRCVGEMPIDPDWKNFYGDNNPYRAAALGLTTGQEGETVGES